jgi:hypothetical protein
MLCPSCGSEYREGFARCADCDVDLVSDLPPVPPSGDPRSQIELVEVFETGDPGEMSVFEALLNDAGIDFTTSSETAKDYYAGGRFGGSFGFGPTKYFVRSEDEATAREVIANLGAQAPPPEEPE